MEWKNIYRGFLMGVSDLIPGVSGGTIAVLLGIYDRLIFAISALLKKDCKKQFGFLIPLGIGMVTAIVSLSHIIKWLSNHYPYPLQFLFLGLIIGVLPNLFSQFNERQKFKANNIIILIISAIIVGASGTLIPIEINIIQDRTLSIYALFFVSGFIASVAMILPGISGALILMIVGVYYTAIDAINNFYLDIIATIGVGIILGIVVMSKFINFLLTYYRTATFALIIGMVVGSIFIVFEGWPKEMLQTLLSIFTFSLGLVGAYLLGKFKHN